LDIRLVPWHGLAAQPSELLVMEIRYYRDPATGLPHHFDHRVTESEAEWIFAHPVGDGEGDVDNEKSAVPQRLE
jgi:hypothetical protein